MSNISLKIQLSKKSSPPASLLFSLPHKHSWVGGGARDEFLTTSTWTVNIKSGSKRLKLARTKAGSGETRLYSFYDFSGLVSTFACAKRFVGFEHLQIVVKENSQG